MTNDSNTNLNSIYSCSNSGCEGCSILEKPKPFHAYMDYQTVGEYDVLFLSDSLKWDGIDISPFSSEEHDIIERYASTVLGGIPWIGLASVKCPSVFDKTITAKDKNICRKYVEQTIDHVKPKLVFACGNLPMNMLLKKSGILKKRGNSYQYTSPNGHECIVVPIYHPFVVIKEPSNVTLFQQDIRVAVDKFIHGKTEKLKLDYKIIMSLEELKEYEFLFDTSYDIAVDIETTGLNFLVDDIMTVAVAYRDGDNEQQIIIPFKHRESPFDKEDLDTVVEFLVKVGKNPSNLKIFQNGKFDMRYLGRYGIRFVNVWDTQTLAHLENETQPKGLMDLVKRFYPQYLETL